MGILLELEGRISSLSSNLLNVSGSIEIYAIEKLDYNTYRAAVGARQSIRNVAILA